MTRVSRLSLWTECVCVCEHRKEGTTPQRSLESKDFSAFKTVCACNSWVSSVLKNNWPIVLDQELIIGQLHCADEAVIPRRRTFHLVTLTCCLYFHPASFELPSSALTAVCFFFPGFTLQMGLQNSLIHFDKIQWKAFFPLHLACCNAI